MSKHDILYEIYLLHILVYPYLIILYNHTLFLKKTVVNSQKIQNPIWQKEEL